MGINEYQPMPVREASLLNSLQLAHIGDAVWTMLVRTRLIYQKCNVHHMHMASVAGVNAHAQALALSRMSEFLTEQQSDVVRRGRNAHARHPNPRSKDPADYAASTGLEALMGFLYVTGQEERILELFSIAKEEI